MNNTVNKPTSKEMMYAAIEGRKLEHFPVATPYLMLAHADHWTELTGQPLWRFYEWIISEPDKHAQMYKVFDEKMPFDIVQPWHATSSEERENTEVVLKEGVGYYHNKKEDTCAKLPDNTHESGSGGGPAEKRIVFDKADVRDKVKVEKAETGIAKGYNDYLDKLIKILGDRKFVINGGIVNTFYSCSYYVGMTNLYSLLYDEPDFIHYLSGRILEQNIETIRRYAAAGGDAIYIDDATATCDMISQKFYEEFSLPYMKEEVKETQRLGKKAILVYFGGIADRVEQILSTGADALMMETSMKSYVNDFEAIAEQINGRMCLFGNLNPYVDIEISSGRALYDTVAKQVKTGRKYGRYVTSTGSPLTPKTPVSRIRRFIDIGHEL